GIAALDHAMDVAQRPQKFCAFDRDLHGKPASAPVKKHPNPGARLAGRQAGEQRWQERAKIARAMDRQVHRATSPHRAGRGLFAAYSCSCRLRISISSASAMSEPPVTRPSILRTACSTVV